MSTSWRAGSASDRRELARRPPRAGEGPRRYTVQADGVDPVDVPGVIATGGVSSPPSESPNAKPPRRSERSVSRRATNRWGATCPTAARTQAEPVPHHPSDVRRRVPRGRCAARRACSVALGTYVIRRVESRTTGLPMFELRHPPRGPASTRTGSRRPSPCSRCPPGTAPCDPAASPAVPRRIPTDRCALAARRRTGLAVPERQPTELNPNVSCRRRPLPRDPDREIEMDRRSGTSQSRGVHPHSAPRR